MKKILIGCLLALFPLQAMADDPPVFSLSWSEYPSWSTFGVAGETVVGENLLVNPEKGGKPGSIEQKYNVDLVFHLRDYDTCIQEYSTSSVDAVCITNMDIESPCLGRRSTVILANSTSAGGDMLITSKSITELKQLKGKKVYGLSNSVSQYAFDRILIKAGLDPKDFTFAGMDPSAAAIKFQQKDRETEAIMVWNPYALETLNKRQDAHRLATSQNIPGEIIDMTVMSAEALRRPGGDRAAMAIIDAFYHISNRLADAETRDETLTALGEKFARLSTKDMRQITKRDTQFYDSPGKSIALLESPQFKQTMDTVTQYCFDKDIIKSKPIVAFMDNNNNKMTDHKGAAVAASATPHLLIDTSYLRRYQSGK